MDFGMKTVTKKPKGTDDPYNKRGKFGFIYRKEPTENSKQSHDLDDVDHDIIANGMGTEHVAKRPRNLNDLQGSLDDDDSSIDSQTLDICMEEGWSDKDPIEREVELKKFISELRSICLAHRSSENSSEIDKSLDILAKEYKKSGLIFRYYEADSPLSPHPMTEDIKSKIEYSKGIVDKYDKEMKGWDEAIEEKRLKVDHAKQTFESERDVDFSRLYCDDVETLKSYLLPEQSKILEEPVMANPWFREEAALKLNAINIKLDGELKHLQSHCHHINSRLKWSGNLDASSVEDTPRTLFKALRNHM